MRHTCNPGRWTILPAMVLALGIMACGGGGDDGGKDVLDTGGLVDPGEPVDPGSPEDPGERDTGYDPGVSQDPGIPDDVGDPCLVSPRPFGCPCEKQTDCLSGWCVLMPDESRRCTVTCIENCPEGWNCEQVLISGDPMFLCVPYIEPLCNRACLNDGACGLDASCTPMERSQFCLAPCETDEDCPMYPPSSVDYEEGLTFYECVEVDNWDGSVTRKQCMPLSGHCKCTPDINYDNDPLHCGACENVCGIDPLRPDWESNATWSCAGGACKVAGCELGWIDLNGLAEDGCEYECTYQGGNDVPDPDGIDFNCDGIDGNADASVFVDIETGDDEDNLLGDMRHPFKTINAAVTFAATTDPKLPVLVSKGQYQEQLRLLDGVSVYGGYDATANWSRDIAKNRAMIVWSGQEPQAVRAVVAQNITSPTVFQGFTVRAQGSIQSSGSSYGIYVYQANAGLVIENNEIQSGNGMDGSHGANGSNGLFGTDGVIGSNTFEYDRCGLCIGCSIVDFDTYMKPGPGGTNECDTAGGKGGAGGKHKSSGSTGETAPNGGGSGGAAGSRGSHGSPGLPGNDGSDGQPGLGGVAAGSLTPAGLWVPGSGGNGTDGLPGKGGGGGGGGGGDTDDFCRSAGGGGGGGGAGGCPGSGGKAGTGGGGTFGVFIVEAKPVIRNNAIQAGFGGNGGLGGGGGNAGNGGKAGDGGGQADDSDAGRGGNGGKGGKGGKGGGGGGGSGGPSFPIYVLGGSSDPACMGNDLAPGAGGQGGLGGGGSSANKGQDGPSGKVFGPTPNCQP